MPRNPIKILTFGCAGAAFAALFGISLASYAESGSFGFYKRAAYTQWDVAESTAPVEMPGYPISPPSAPTASPVIPVAAPRPVYSPGYPGDGLSEEPRAEPARLVYEPAEPEDAPAVRVVRGSGGSWTQPAREPELARAEGDDVVYVESAEGEGSDGPLEEMD